MTYQYRKFPDFGETALTKKYTRHMLCHHIWQPEHAEKDSASLI